MRNFRLRALLLPLAVVRRAAGRGVIIRRASNTVR